MVLKTANSVPPSQQNRARQPRQDTAKSAKSTASSSSVRALFKAAEKAGPGLRWDRQQQTIVSSHID